MVWNSDYNTLWTWISLGILFAMIPAVLFTLGRADLIESKPSPEAVQRLLSLARALDEAADRFLWESSRVAVLNPKGKRALDAFLNLGEQSEAFYRLLQRANPSAKEVRKRYRRLSRAYAAARREIPNLASAKTHPELLEKLDQSLINLANYTRSAGTGFDLSL